MKKLFLLLLAVLSLSLCASAQMRTVQGTVIDAENDEPLVGASVQAGKGIGVSTNYDGEFSIRVPQGTATLTVSYVGYNTQEVKITDGNMIIRLESNSTLLDPVIVVAYGEQKNPPSPAPLRQWVRQLSRKRRSTPSSTLCRAACRVSSSPMLRARPQAPAPAWLSAVSRRSTQATRLLSSSTALPTPVISRLSIPTISSR